MRWTALITLFAGCASTPDRDVVLEVRESLEGHGLVIAFPHAHITFTDCRPKVRLGNSQGTYGLSPSGEFIVLVPEALEGTTAVLEIRQSDRHVESWGIELRRGCRIVRQR